MGAGDLLTASMLAALVALAAGDVRRLRIGNRLLAVCYAIALLWFLVHPAAFGVGVPLSAAAFFAAGTALWAMGVIGGGDAKALPLCGLFAGAAVLAPTLVVLAFGVLLLRLAPLAGRRVPAGGAPPSSHAGPRAPLGVPIAAAAMAALLMRAAAI